MKSPANAESLVLAHQLGAAAGEPDEALSCKLGGLADTEPNNDAERCAREMLTCVLTGAELAKARRAMIQDLHGSADEAEPETDVPHARQREQPRPARRSRSSVATVELDLCVR